MPVAQIGATVYGSRFYSTVAAILPGVAITNIQVNGANSVITNINQVPALGTITVVLV